MTPAETRYAVYDKELLAIRDALRNWRHLLYAKENITVITDHQTLSYLVDQIESIPRTARTTLENAEYRPVIEYRPGHENGAADALSRRGGALYWVAAFPTLEGLEVQLQEAVERDSRGAELVKTEGTFGSRYVPAGTSGPVYRREGGYTQVVVPADLELRARQLALYHDSPVKGHLGGSKTLAVIRRHWWWRNLEEDVTKYVKACDECARNKATNQVKQAYYTPLSVPDRPGMSLSMDYITGLPLTRHRHDAILTVVDRFSKYIWEVPCETGVTAKRTVLLLFKNVFKDSDFPADIVSDRAGKFLSDLWGELVERGGIKYSTHGVAPAEAFMQDHLQALASVKKALQVHRKHLQAKRNQRRRDVDPNLKEGALVYIRRDILEARLHNVALTQRAKLSARFPGPFRVQKVYYAAEEDGGHATHLKVDLSPLNVATHKSPHINVGDVRVAQVSQHHPGTEVLPRDFARRLQEQAAPPLLDAGPIDPARIKAIITAQPRPGVVDSEPSLLDYRFLVRVREGRQSVRKWATALQMPRQGPASAEAFLKGRGLKYKAVPLLMTGPTVPV